MPPITENERRKVELETLEKVFKKLKKKKIVSEDDASKLMTEFSKERKELETQ